MIVIFGTHVSNDDISSKFFHFSKFWFWGFYGGKRTKDDLKLPISVCFALYPSIYFDHVDQTIKILIMISTGVFLYYFF